MTLARLRATAGRSRLYASLALGCVALWIALVIIGWPASRYLHGDFIQYWLSARALLDGRDVYDPQVWRMLHDEVGSRGDEIADPYGFIYPLSTAVAALPFGLLPLAAAAPAWFLAQTASAVVGLAALGRRLYTARPRRDLTLLLILAALMQPTYVVAGDGNIVRFLPGIVAGSLALLLAERPLAAGLLLGLAVIKPHLLLFYVVALLLLCAPAQRLRLALGGALTAGALVLAAFLLRPGWVDAWLRQASGARGTYGHWTIWGLAPSDAPWSAPLVVATLVAVFAWWWRRARPPFVVAAATALVLSELVAPYSWNPDTALLLVPVAVYLAVIEGVRGARRALWLAVLVLTSPALVWLTASGVVPAGWWQLGTVISIGILLPLADRATRSARTQDLRGRPSGAA